MEPLSAATWFLHLLRAANLSQPPTGVVLYDVDFNHQQAESPVVLDNGAVPRARPTVVTGEPVVVRSFDALVDQRLLFDCVRDKRDGNLCSKVELRLADADLPNYAVYSIAFDLILSSPGSMLHVMLDVPSSHLMAFHGGGTILFRGRDPSDVSKWKVHRSPVRVFHRRELVRVSIRLDRQTKEWSASVNGAAAYSGNLRRGGDFRSLRFIAHPGTLAAIDNIVIVGFPEVR